ncbi:ABC-2 transporter permease [Mediterraneibacter agrestimuris]|uniref:ABC-2 transporter permease n=1 Tax=Mediterraneibacter agrestimuris TaxID=2941333 RepID=UPI00203F2633|nr:ABC-2 transporter permease [Mediterraneibacter agrestimuris]
MKGMMIKDFDLLKSQKSFFLAAGFFVVFFLGVTEQYQFAISYLTIMCGLIALVTISYDEYDNGFPFLFTMPISRKEYVKGKYVFYILISALGWMLSLLLGIGTVIIRGGEKEEIMILFFTAAGALGIGMLIGAVAVPIQFKFGSDKRQIAIIASFAVVFVVVYLGEKLMEIGGIETSEIMISLSKIPMGMWAALGTAAVIVLVLISYLISVRIMDKKEF